MTQTLILVYGMSQCKLLLLRSGKIQIKLELKGRLYLSWRPNR